MHDGSCNQSVEQGVWLSDSEVWRRLARFYQDEGPNAWHARIPYHVTSNPHIAAGYVDLIQAFLDDWIVAHGAIDGTVHVVELGSGHGVFTGHMLQALAEAEEDFNAIGVRVHYIASDLAQSNVAGWQQNPVLSAALDAGWASFARFDCLADADPSMLFGAQDWPSGAGAAPCIFIANYLFDTLPQDIFLLREDETLRATVRFGQAGNSDTLDPERFELSFDFRPYVDSDLPPAVSRRVADYRQAGLRGHVVVPTGALACVERLRMLSDDRMLLVCSDKALSTEHALRERSLIEVGSFVSASMLVNMHAIGRHVEEQGGVSLLQSTQQSTLATAAWLIGLSRPQSRRSARTFARQLDAASPGDVYGLVNAMLPHRFNMDVAALLSLLKLTDWDAAVFEGMYDALLSRLGEAMPAVSADLLAALPRIASNRNRLPGAPDTLFRIAHLCQHLQRWDEAATLYQHSMAERGESAEAHYNLALCHLGAGDAAKARDAFERAAALNPDMLMAQGWLHRLEAGCSRPA
ncbi:SAM-dependent methyltransferase [Dyella choica]|uniref:Tetratricopeptide repeat protein n=1 Tax=Dyella choica TaxID=1927959 RepID=A0A3S0WYT8_9GAMM|nr:tetratricopeptide repeat protein [Dyella choica]RUL79937.1 tetratricopeptide repeat protein [Dyella choica]